MVLRSTLPVFLKEWKMYKTLCQRDKIYMLTCIQILQRYHKRWIEVIQRLDRPMAMGLLANPVMDGRSRPMVRHGNIGVSLSSYIAA